MNPHSHLRVSGESRLCEVALNLAEPSQASAARRVFTRAVKNPLVRGGVVLVAGVLIGNVLGFVRAASGGADPKPGTADCQIRVPRGHVAADGRPEGLS